MEFVFVMLKNREGREIEKEERETKREREMRKGTRKMLQLSFYLLID